VRVALARESARLEFKVASRVEQLHDRGISSIRYVARCGVQGCALGCRRAVCLACGSIG
jgi:hypothetical protein